MSIRKFIKSIPRRALYRTNGFLFSTCFFIVVATLMWTFWFAEVSLHKTVADRADVEHDLKLLRLLITKHQKFTGVKLPLYHVDTTGRRLYGWRVVLISQSTDLFTNGFDLGESWDSNRNSLFAQSTPDLFVASGDRLKRDRGVSSYSPVIDSVNVVTVNGFTVPTVQDVEYSDSETAVWTAP